MTDLTFIDSLRAIVGGRGVVTEARCSVLPHDTQEVSAVVGLYASVGVPIVPLGGSISAEHGIVWYRVKKLKHCRSLPELELAHRVKHVLDPSGFMNPGKVLALLNVENVEK